MIKTHRIPPFVMAVTLLVSFAVSAEPGTHNEKEHKSAHHFTESWAKTLSDDQKSRVDMMHLELDRELVVLKAQEELVQKHINALAARDNVATNTLHAKIDELMGIKKQIMRSRYAHILEMRAILTPAQRISYDMGILERSGVK